MNQIDFVKDRYLVKYNFKDYSIDITSINQKTFLLLAIDLGSKLILFSALRNNIFTTQHVIKIIQDGFMQKSIHQEHSIVLYSDWQSKLTENELKSFAENHDIILSPNLAGEDRFGMKVSESIIDSITIKLKESILNYLINLPSLRQVNFVRHSLAQLSSLITFHELTALTRESITKYNHETQTNKYMQRLALSANANMLLLP